MNKSRLALLSLLLIVLMLVLRPVLAIGSHQEGYPPPQQPDVVQPTLTSDPYPPSQLGTDAVTPIPIGVQAGAQTPQQSAPDTAASEPSERGLLFLWVGFLATFLVFLTSVVGSIILFTRRNES